MKRIYAGKIEINFVMPPQDRHKIENLLKEMGYGVDGGGTNLIESKSEIFITHLNLT